MLSRRRRGGRRRDRGAGWGGGDKLAACEDDGVGEDLVGCYAVDGGEWAVAPSLDVTTHHSYCLKRSLVTYSN